MNDHLYGGPLRPTDTHVRLHLNPKCSINHRAGYPTMPGYMPVAVARELRLGDYFATHGETGVLRRCWNCLPEDAV